MLQRGAKHGQPRLGEAVSLAGRGATFRSQAGALFRKNAVYQKRNWGSNVCLLSAPIFFCLLLFGIQVAINKLLLTGDDYSVRGGCARGVGALRTQHAERMLVHVRMHVCAHAPQRQPAGHMQPHAPR